MYDEETEVELLPVGDKHDVHHYFHTEPRNPVIGIKVEKLTKGFNFEASVQACSSVEEAMRITKELVAALVEEYG